MQAVGGQKRAREVELDEDGEEVEVEVEVEEGAPGGPLAKKTRMTRKITLHIFGDRSNGKCKCLLGCIKDRARMEYAYSSTKSIERHGDAKHPEYMRKFRLAKDNKYSFQTLLNEIEEEKKKNDEKLKKSKKPV